MQKLSEKAVLPTRGSLLSAGYDLSRCVILIKFLNFRCWKPRIVLMGLFMLLFCSAIETKVPARGKALIPTDLSIAIPEGTYARVGKLHNLRNVWCLHSR